MAGKGEFGSTLVRIREAQGFATAHSFYNACSGRSHFQMTFRNYLNVEQGNSLPKPERLEAILEALGVGDHSPQAKELAGSYLADMGLSNILRFIADGAGHAPPKETGLLQHAVQKAIQPQMVHLTQDQWKAIAASYESYVCEYMLQSTLGGFGLKELAKATGLGLPAIKGAIAKLDAAGLARLKGERATHVYEGKIVEALPKIPATVGLWSKIVAHRKRLADEGKVVQESMGMVRLTSANLKKLRHDLDQFFLTPFVYDDPKPSPDSAIYMIRTDIRGLFHAKD